MMYGRDENGFENEKVNEMSETTEDTGFENMKNSANADHAYEESVMHTEEYSADAFIRRNRRTERPKSRGFGSKVAMVTALGMVFGLVSGGTFQAVNMASNYAVAKETTTAEEATKTVATTLSKVTGDTSAQTTVSTTTSSGMTVQQVAQTVLPATVAINCTGTTIVNTMWGNAQQEYSSCGTGIIVGQNDTELLIATNNHVVESSSNVSVVFTNDTSADAQIKGTDADNDLAVIAVPLESIDEETMNAIAIAEIGDSNALEVGEQVVAIGNALGYGQSVTTGIVSALNRGSETEDGTGNLIQTDAAINPGNSGGALVNMKGQVIGINSAKYASEDVEGMGFAIPISAASSILDDLMNRETRTEVADSESSYLGIQGQDISSEVAQAYNMPKGIYVTAVGEGSPAEEGGLQSGDIIQKFDGISTKEMTELQNQMKYYASGETVVITVQRCINGEYVEKELSVTLGHREVEYHR